MDLEFAYDIAIFAEDNDTLHRSTECLSQEASKIGLRISPEKSKVMHAGNTTSRDGIYVGTDRLEVVDNFTYLRSMIISNGDAEADVRCRTAKAVFRSLKPLWMSSSISNSVKQRLYSSIAFPTAVYASETWKMSASIIRRVNAFHCKCLRQVMRIRYTDRLTNEEVLRRCRSSNL
ncbi:unnamed protein product [Heligmosomoides polygyrus]|uniref:Reverse transcriptase domain-containing protein n=1 Tax=Heligmosomoides polygyrus TaxID=6339 RepID=A0A183GGS3_HELPZ|nr:unnamed protein product [Heligmosomoides polygyrus]